MWKLLFVFALLGAKIHAADLKPKITAYLYSYFVPEKHISFRLLAKEVVCSMELASSDLFPMQDALRQARERSQNEPMGIVIVGDFIEKDMHRWLEAYLGGFIVEEGAKETLRHRLEGGGMLLSAPVLANYFADRHLLGEATALEHFFPREELLQSGEEGTNMYAKLPINHEERKIISYIITTMAKKNVVSLLLEKKTLEKKGKKIEDVHPLRFVGTILADPQLREYMHSLVKSSFKWNGFIDGFGRRMKEESNRGNLLRYVPSFAQELHADEDKVKRYIQNQDWEGLVRYLL